MMASASSTPASKEPATSFEVVRIRANGVHWRVLRAGEGPPLLLLHGTASSASTLTDLGSRLARRFTVLAPDLPGHAGSQLDADFVPSLPNVATGVARLLEVLHVEPVVIAGHSAGAAVGIEMALRGTPRPRLLIGMASAVVPFGRTETAVYGGVARALARSPLASRWIARRARTTDVVAQVLAGTGSRITRDEVERLRELTSRPEHVAGVLTMLASWDLGPVFDSLPALRAPLLLLAGGCDRAIPMVQQRAILARVPKASLVVIEGAGHFLPTERPAEVADEIGRAFDEVAS